MNKYLIEILKIQNSVILPGLGALMVPSEKSGGKIVFNQHLKFNDGSLARFIAEKEGIDQQESQNKVAKFIREIEAELGQGNTYDMFEFGQFYKNKDGDVDFKMDGDTKVITSPPPVIEKKKKPVSPAAETAKKEKKSPPKKATEKKKTVDKVKEDITKKGEELEKKATNLKAAAEKKATDLKKVATDTVADIKVEKAKVDEPKKAKNKFVPPVSSVKETATNIAKDITEKTDKLKEKAKAVADEASAKVAALKADQKKAADTKAAAEKIEASKQQKNTFIPPVETAKKAVEETVKKPVEVIKKTTAKIVPVVPEDAKKVIEKSKPLVTNIKATAAKTTVAAASTVATATTTVKETVIVEKEKRSKWPWLILLLLLIGAGVAGFFYKDQLLAYFDKDSTPAIDSTTHNSADSEITENNLVIDAAMTEDTAAINTMEDTLTGEFAATDGLAEEGIIDEGTEVVAEELEPEIETPEVVESNPVASGSNNGNYHLIGNSFGEEANAERYVKKMQDKGYPAKVLGRFDGLYLVSLKSYNSRSEASSGRSSVTADAGSAWIFNYPK